MTHETDITLDTSAWLRAQPALVGDAPPLEVDDLPGEPLPLFLRWMKQAADSGVAVPHAATLATVDAEGMPDARTLILKDVDERGWAFASRRSSRKGAQLAANPVAALNFWWQPIVRAVRVRGRVIEATPEESAADDAARPVEARAGAAIDDWVLWRIAPQRVEFWQGELDRRHSRIVFDAQLDGWTRTIRGRAGDGSLGH